LVAGARFKTSNLHSMNDDTRPMIDKDLIRRNLLKYTRRAFRTLPKIEKPHILDIGCGSGIPTVELAKLSGGDVIGIDIDQSQLDILKGRIEFEGLSDRIKIQKCSMEDIDFPDASFDIIWAEGSIMFIGFKRGLRSWRKFIKSQGFLVVHDELEGIETKLKQITSSGYKLLDYFILSKEVWWSEYYGPMKRVIQETQAKHYNDPETLDALNNAQKEVDYFEQNPDRCSSVFLIMRKLQ